MQTDAAMLAIAERLAVVIADETAALERHDWPRLHLLADAKRQATADYERALAALGDPHELSAQARVRLGAVGRRLAALAAENERRLSVVMAAQRRVIAVISEAVSTAGGGIATYGRSGDMSRGRTASAPLAVSVDCAL